ncbi:hypothetical protein CLIB1444_07S07602 [[Candida] jaroonii]|uniref:Uncharacterized protein n=1 Tax=[Candida] jaroonii TaxID=467808 RepID=A0ACA9YBM8_9ASCO|nr:hypothetical protein CLIB1444_07S07602 [[Candida] jaroonii]
MEYPLIYDDQLIIGVKSDDGYSLKYESNDDVKLNLEIFNQKKTIVIDSSNSGTGRLKRDIYNPILKVLLEKYNVQHDYHYTESADSISQIARNLPSGNLLVLIISGDTSVNEFLNSLSGEGGELTIVNIPFGTGNSLALSLEDNELTAIAKLFTSTPVHEFNLYDISLPPNCWELKQSARVKQMPTSYKFIVVFSWGFHASLVADSDTPELRKFGLERFKMAAMKNLQSPHQYPGSTFIDKEEYGGPYNYWLITPSRKFEPTFEISPDGSIFDDSLFLISFGVSVDTMSVMQQVYDKGNHIKNPDVIYNKVQNQEIILKFENLPSDVRRFCIDGLIIEVPPSGEIKLKSTGNTINNWNIFIM